MLLLDKTAMCVEQKAMFQATPHLPEGICLHRLFHGCHKGANGSHKLLIAETILQNLQTFVRSFIRGQSSCTEALLGAVIMHWGTAGCCHHALRHCWVLSSCTEALLGAVRKYFAGYLRQKRESHLWEHILCFLYCTLKCIWRGAELKLHMYVLYILGQILERQTRLFKHHEWGSQINN